MTEGARGHLAMLAFSALVAGSFSLGSLAVSEIAPVALNAARFFLAGCLCAAIAAVGGHFRRVHFQAPWRYVALAAFFAIYFVLMFEGLKTAPPVSAAAVFTLTPIMAAGFGYLLLRQILTPRMAFALSVGAAGALCVIFRADFSALLQFRIGEGEMIYFIGCASHAIYTPLLPKLNRGEPPVVTTTLILAAGTVLIGVYGWRDLIETDWGSLPSIVWLTLIYISVFASAGAFMLLQFASQRLPASKVMAYTYLTPSWVLLWEIGLGHGVPPIWVLGGVALTILALAILLKPEEA